MSIGDILLLKYQDVKPAKPNGTSYSPCGSALTAYSREPGFSMLHADDVAGMVKVVPISLIANRIVSVRRMNNVRAWA
jgi:hypothetical protein